MLHIARLEIDWSRRRRRSRRRGVREIGALRALRNAEMGAIIAPSLSTSVSDSLPSARPSFSRSQPTIHRGSADSLCGNVSIVVNHIASLFSWKCKCGINLLLKLFESQTGASGVKTHFLCSNPPVHTFS